MSNLIHVSKEYQQWIQELSKRFRRSQIKASVKVNREMLAFYWELGREIVARNAENTYGKGFYANLSQDLRHAIPDADGFSETSVRYAKRFYELYFQLIKNLPQVVETLDKENLPQVVEIFASQNRPQVGDDFTAKIVARLLNELFSIPGDTSDILLTNVLLIPTRRYSMCSRP